MPRKRRYCPPGLPVHVVQRGNNRQVYFASDADMKAYAHWLRAGAEKYGVAVHAWVFMTNHVHLLLTPSSRSGAADSVSRCMQYLGRYYVPYFNHRHQRSGTLFEGRFKSNIVQARGYLLACQRYIELNPVRAGMVSDPADYTWSSYRAHAFGGRGRAKMWQPHPEYLALGDSEPAREAAYRRYFAEQCPMQLITDIRQALNTGLVLGNDHFRQEVEELTGQRQQLLPRGPRPHKSDRAPR
jgi:putative transposase